MTSTFQPSNDEEQHTPLHLDLYTRIDTIWMLSHAQRFPNIPMWVGFNTEITGDDSPQQLISYLTPINSSPTNTAVVLETMQQSIKILEELNQSYIL